MFFFLTCLWVGRAQAKKDAESSRAPRGLPDMSDLEAVQKFFVQELQFGEELLAMGKSCCLTLSPADCEQPIDRRDRERSGAPEQCHRCLWAAATTAPDPAANSAGSRLPANPGPTAGHLATTERTRSPHSCRQPGTG